MTQTLLQPERLVSKNQEPPVWCAGCGDFGVLQALTRALQDLGRTPKDTVLVSGIGCSGRLPYFVDAYGFHTLHGRALPVALGVKMANPELTVVVVGGDGDGFGIGGGHVPHIARRNVDITYLILDNGVYALTKGHSSPTTVIGQKTKSSKNGEHDRPLDILGMLLMYRTSFVASAYSGDRPRLTDLIRQAIEHKGFSAVHIQSPCPTYNLDMNYDSLRETLYTIPEDHPRGDLLNAIKLHFEHTGLIDGVLHQQSELVSQSSANNSNGLSLQQRFSKLVARYA